MAKDKDYVATPPKGVFPADARSRDGMPHDMGGHEGNPQMCAKEGERHGRHESVVQIVMGSPKK